MFQDKLPLSCGTYLYFSRPTLNIVFHLSYHIYDVHMNTNEIHPFVFLQHFNIQKSNAQAVDYHGFDSLPRRVDCRSKPEIYFISIFCRFNVIAHAVETLCHGTQWPVYPLYSQHHNCWWFNIDSDNGLLPDSAEPLPEPQQVPVAFIWGHYLNSLRPRLTTIGSDNGLSPSHYLNHCWNIVNWTLGNKLQ